MPDKKPLAGLYRDNPKTKEGKYLVKRRDGTVPEWPSFVLGGADPYAEVALRAYAQAVQDDIFTICMAFKNAGAEAIDKELERVGLSREWMMSIRRWADEFRAWRLAHGDGDPGMGQHRVDDPATIEEMKKGYSA